MPNITRDKDQLVNQITGLDFFTIRARLENWMKSQEQFTDYNFAGPNLSALLDLLSFNTHYMGFYANSIVSEAFLSTGVQRAAVVSKARDRGYLPRSTRSATASIIVNLESTAGELPFITIPAGTKFTSNSGGTRYTYVLLKTVLAYPVTVSNSPTGIYSAHLEIVEGTLITQTNVITADNVEDPIELANQNIDTSTISVQVYPTSTSNPILYSLFDGSFTLTASSPAFFVEEIDNLQYSIHFGDGILGVKLESGNIVSTSFLVSSGALANGAVSFSISSALQDGKLSTNPSYPGIITISPSSGGNSIEDIKSIKFNAPLSFQAQRRTVTPIDYQSILKDKFSFIKSMAVWGGEKNDPIALGYVFLSIFPTAGPILLTESQKYDIETYVSNKFSILNIRPIVVDPEYLYITIDTKLKINPNANNPLSSLEQSVIDTILNFNSTLVNFGSYFRYSKLVTNIDNTSSAITNSLTTVRVQRKLNISNQFSQNYSFKLFNAIIPNTFSSSTFAFTSGIVTYPQAFFADNGSGTINLVYRNTLGTIVTIASSVGTVNYASGDVTLTSVKVDQVNPTSAVEIVSFSAKPESDDIYSIRNGILVIDQSGITVSASADIV